MATQHYTINSSIQPYRIIFISCTNNSLTFNYKVQYGAFNVLEIKYGGRHV